MSVLVCSVLERLSRAPPPPPPRPRGRATPVPHGGTRCYWRKNGPQRQTRRAGGVERSRPRSPLWRRIVDGWKSLHEHFVNSRCCKCYCCTAVHGGWVGYECVAVGVLAMFRSFSGYEKGVSSWGVANRETGARSSKPRRNMPSCV